MNQSDETRTCPYCFELIKGQAIRCKYCHADLNGNHEAQANDQATIGGAYGVTIGGQGFRIEGGIHYTLSELDTLDEKSKIELTSHYEAIVRDFPELAQYHFALGLSYLGKGLYDLSTASLHRALGKTSNEAALLYYLALSHIAGRRPRTLHLTTIRRIDNYLKIATELAPKVSHYKILLAIVRYDYYVGNGMRSPEPSHDKLIRDASLGEIDYKEIEIIASHLSMPRSELIAVLRTA